MNRPPRLFITAKSTLIGIAGFLLAQAAWASDWWNDEWQNRMQLTVDPTAADPALESAPGTTPVLLRLHGGNFPFGEISQDGSDIRFVAEDNETVLDYEIERIDSLLQEAFVWVEVPDLAADSPASVWLYHGKMGPAEQGEDSAAVFGDTSLLVYHFSENGAAPADASGRGNHGDRPGISVQGALIGGGLRLTGRQPITAAASPSVAVPAGGPLTVSTWASSSSPVPDGAIVSRSQGGTGFEFGLNNGVPYVDVISGGASNRISAAEPVASGTWTHLAFSGDGSGTTLYVDGVPVNSQPIPIPAMDGDVRIGVQSNGDPGFQGEIDELRIQSVAPPPGRLQFAALTEGADPVAQQMITLAYDDAGGGGWLDGEGYFFVVLNTLDASGWTVIVILIIMFIWSIFVMAIKIVSLSRIRKTNGRFIRMWHAISHDLTVLDKPEEIKTLGGKVAENETVGVTDSPVYKLYHTGVDEIQMRFKGADSGTRRLTGASLQAIRSAMMTTYVRQTQRLNKRVVHLQIAVAGGPFLGLFGTVLGVTVTFAVIASSGDVNVASIAPGVSGALLTTVAGLIVAIPALFGYNYIVGQIKDVVNDMRVFTDEFVTKAAEFYSRKSKGQPASSEYADDPSSEAEEKEVMKAPESGETPVTTLPPPSASIPEKPAAKSPERTEPLDSAEPEIAEPANPVPAPPDEPGRIEKEPTGTKEEDGHPEPEDGSKRKKKKDGKKDKKHSKKESADAAEKEGDSGTPSPILETRASQVRKDRT